MRLFAILCYGIAVFYGYTAVEAMRTGVTTALNGDDGALHRRDDPASKYAKFLLARWMFAGGFVAVGMVMRVFAGKFEKLEAEKPPPKP
jgi:hypothetical protein